MSLSEGPHSTSRGLQGARVTRPPVSSEGPRPAVPVLSSRRVVLPAVRAVRSLLSGGHFLPPRAIGLVALCVDVIEFGTHG